MTSKTLDFNTLTAANPYIIGSAPDNLTGYALYGSGVMRISTTPPKSFLPSSGNPCIYDTTDLTSDVMSSEIIVGSTGTWGGPALINSANGNGYFLQQDSNANRLYCFKVVAGAQGAQIGTFVLNTEAPGMSIIIERTNSSGLIRAIVDGVEVATFTDATTSTNRAAAISQGLYIRSLTSTFQPALEIIDFNGDDDIYNGQTAIPFEINSELNIVSVTTNQEGVTVSSIVNNGDGTGTVNIGTMVDGVKYPVLPSSVIFTFTDSDDNIGTYTKTLALEPGWSQVSYLNAMPISDSILCWHFQNAGLSIADGSRAIWEAIEGFSCDADGDTTSNAERTVLIKYVPQGSADPADDNIVSFWTVTINEAGEVVSADRGLTAKGLTATGLTARNLTAVGL